MTTTTLHAWYAAATLIGVVSILAGAQLAVVSWIFKFICEELGLEKARKGFVKFKRWAYAILFATAIVSIAATLALMVVFKVQL